MKNLIILFVLGMVCAEARAQQGVDTPSRSEEIEGQQAAKAKTLSPDLPDRAERRFVKIENALEDVFSRSPIHLQLGGLPMASGFGLGPVVEMGNSTESITGKVWAVGSVRQYYSVGAGLELPRLTGQRFSVVVDASHMDSPQLDFYGLGPTSLRSNRTDYRREDTLLNLAVHWPISPHFQPNCRITQDFLNVGPGTNNRVTSTDVKFGPSQAPGIQEQSDFLIGGCTLPLDFRDNSAFPHKGTMISAGFERFTAQDQAVFSFNRLSASGEQYIPFWNEKRVIALHAATQLSFHPSSGVVPFYMQPTLGGYDDLRGFRPRRFYDENAIVANAEYRWEVCTGLDMAIFADTGKVFHRPGQINLSELQTSAGFGFRFNNGQSSVMRLDTAFSREGFQVWFVFNRVF